MPESSFFPLPLTAPLEAFPRGAPDPQPRVWRLGAKLLSAPAAVIIAPSLRLLLSLLTPALPPSLG